MADTADVTTTITGEVRKDKLDAYRSACGAFVLRCETEGLLLGGAIDHTARGRVRLSFIRSGAQTGADRGGLEAAHELGIATRGIVPLGWKAEDGVIPDRYRAGLEEHHSPEYPPRTKANVLAADATLIFTDGPIDGGSDLTAQYAQARGKPCLVLDLSRHDNATAARAVHAWLEINNVRELNVAGNRASKSSTIQERTRRVLVAALGEQHA